MVEAGSLAIGIYIVRKSAIASMVFALPLDIVITPLPHELYQELGSACRGPVYLRGDPKYVS